MVGLQFQKPNSALKLVEELSDIRMDVFGRKSSRKMLDLT
jgi:hypothetical protein